MQDAENFLSLVLCQPRLHPRARGADAAAISRQVVPRLSVVHAVRRLAHSHPGGVADPEQQALGPPTAKKQQTKNLEVRSGSDGEVLRSNASAVHLR